MKCPICHDAKKYFTNIEGCSVSCNCPCNGGWMSLDELKSWLQYVYLTEEQKKFIMDLIENEKHRKTLRRNI